MMAAIHEEKKREVEALRNMMEAGKLPAPLPGPRPSFSAALLAPHERTLPVIAEYKRASPSRGDIRLDLLPEDIAARYARAGAACLSVLTEKAFFKGDMSFLARMAPAGLPLLRKDFFFDPLQVRATAATPASALLLNALKAMGGIDDHFELISSQVLEPVCRLKTEYLGHKNPRLHTDEVLMALTISALTNPLAELAQQQLPKLRGCDAHFSVILSEVDESLLKRLGINVSCEARYETKKLYHK